LNRQRQLRLLRLVGLLRLLDLECFQHCSTRYLHHPKHKDFQQLDNHHQVDQLDVLRLVQLHSSKNQELLRQRQLLLAGQLHQ
jgi:hypothetical protein